MYLRDSFVATAATTAAAAAAAHRAIRKHQRTYSHAHKKTHTHTHRLCTDLVVCTTTPQRSASFLRRKTHQYGSLLWWHTHRQTHTHLVSLHAEHPGVTSARRLSTSTTTRQRYRLSKRRTLQSCPRATHINRLPPRIHTEGVAQSGKHTGRGGGGVRKNKNACTYCIINGPSLSRYFIFF